MGNGATIVKIPLMAMHMMLHLEHYSCGFNVGQDSLLLHILFLLTISTTKILYWTWTIKHVTNNINDNIYHGDPTICCRI